MKKILIATPCLDGKVDVWYTNSLCKSIKLGIENDIEFNQLFLAYESILPMARNQLFYAAYIGGCDSLVFIDDDEEWDPFCLLDIVKSEKDVVGVPVVNKSDAEIGYNVYGIDKTPDPKDGYLKASRCGTGFLKISKRVIKDLWESNPECYFRSRKVKYICEYSVLNDNFYGEDIILSEKIKELGYQIWINPNYTISHVGTKKFTGKFR